MDYPNLKYMSALELVIMQYEALKAGDNDFARAILIELGKKQDMDTGRDNLERYILEQQLKNTKAIMDNPQEEIVAYCLKTDKTIKLTWPRNVMGALFTCPFCGIINSEEKTSLHVFNPSQPLIERLKRE